jgi:hypothetical protein
VHHERYIDDAGIERNVMTEAILFTQRFPVIGENQDQTIFQPVVAFQDGQETSELAVDKGHFAQVRGSLIIAKVEARVRLIRIVRFEVVEPEERAAAVFASRLQVAERQIGLFDRR